jgi:hypothetical protein
MPPKPNWQTSTALVRALWLARGYGRYICVRNAGTVAGSVLPLLAPSFQTVALLFQGVGALVSARGGLVSDWVFASVSIFAMKDCTTKGFDLPIEDAAAFNRRRLFSDFD